MVNQLHWIWTFIVVVAGFVVLLTGAALLVLPGPGWLTIMLGLSMLAGHFIWARHLLKTIKHELLVGEHFVEKEIGMKKRK